jgi:hypothetical protein
MAGMGITGREDRSDGSAAPAEHESERRPIPVIVGVISLLAAAVWIAALTPSVRPTLTVEPLQSLTSGLFYVALIVGTLRGVRILWGITLFSSAMVCALVLSTAIEDPRAQTIGGLLLLTVALVCLSLPSALQYEHRRIHLVLV